MLHDLSFLLGLLHILILDIALVILLATTYLWVHYFNILFFMIETFEKIPLVILQHLHNSGKNIVVFL